MIAAINVTTIIYWIVIAAACAACVIIFYFLGKRNMKKRDEQQALIDQSAQQYTMLIIDKKKIRMKDSGLPAQVIEKTPWFARRSKVPVVKVKIGPKIMLLIADNNIFDMIPVKKEVKATVAGIYMTEVKGIRGALEKPKKKRNFFSKLFGEK